MKINASKTSLVILGLLFSLFLIYYPAKAGPCTKKPLAKIRETSIWQINDSIHTGRILAFTSGMAIDADGSPHAYHPCDSGLDALANAGSPGNWFGIYTRKGVPIVQADTSPAPGFYISTTSLQDKSIKEAEPTRYVDAESIPYFVINTANDSACYAIFADTGPKNKIGEGSMALAKALGINSSPRSGGVDSGIVYILFPGSGDGKPKSIAEIKLAGEKEMGKTTGKEKILKCLKEN